MSLGFLNGQGLSLFAAQADGLFAVIGGEDRAGSGMPLEDGFDRIFLIRPGIGEYHIEILGTEFGLFPEVVFVGSEPRKSVGCTQACRASLGDKARVNEFDAHTEVVGQLPGGVDKLLFDLNAPGIEAQHGGQTGHDAETAAPFTEMASGGNAFQGPQYVVRLREIARHEAVDTAIALEALDAPVRLAEERANVSR